MSGVLYKLEERDAKLGRRDDVLGDAGPGETRFFFFVFMGEGGKPVSLVLAPATDCRSRTCGTGECQPLGYHGSLDKGGGAQKRHALQRTKSRRARISCLHYKVEAYCTHLTGLFD